MVMTHRAYYDASGTQNDRDGVLAFVGALATEDAWSVLECEWEYVLRHFERRPYFHYREYAHSEGAFQDWDGQEEKRRDFIAALIEVAGQYVERVVVIGVDVAAYRVVNKKYLLAEYFGADHKDAGAYAVSGYVCLERATRWIMDEKPGTSWGHVIEKGDPGWRALRAATEASSIAGAITYLEKIDPGTNVRIRPFEVADLAAYDCRRYLYDTFIGEDKDIMVPPRRSSYRVLRDKVPLDPAIYDEANLEGLALHDYPIKRRT